MTDNQLTPHYTYINLADDLALVLTTGPQARTRLAAIPDPWEETVTLTPADLPKGNPNHRPFQGHPILDDIAREPEEETMGQWVERRQRQARAPYQPMWSEAIARIRASEFRTRGACRCARETSSMGEGFPRGRDRARHHEVA